MPFYPQNEYKFLRFEPSHLKTKKYDAILMNRKTRKEVRMPFGAKAYQQFKDKTSLKLYQHQDHGDKKRRLNYISRHQNDINKPYSASWFSLKYLW